MKSQKQLYIILLILFASNFYAFNQKHLTQINTPKYADYTTASQADLGFYYYTTSLTKVWEAGSTSIFTGWRNYWYVETPAIDGVNLTKSQTKVEIFNITKRQYAYYENLSVPGINPTATTLSWNMTKTLRQDNPIGNFYSNYNFYITIWFGIFPNTYSATDIVSVNVYLDYINNIAKTDDVELEYKMEWIEGSSKFFAYEINVNNSLIDWDYAYPLYLQEDEIFTISIDFNDVNKPTFCDDVQIEFDTLYRTQPSDLQIRLNDQYFFDTGLDSGILYVDELGSYPTFFYFYDNDPDTDADEVWWLAKFTTFYSHTTNLTIQSSNFLTKSLILTKELGWTLSFYAFDFNSTVQAVYLNGIPHLTNSFTFEENFTDSPFNINIAIILELETPIPTPLSLLSQEQITNGTTSQNLTLRLLYNATMTNYYWSFSIPYEVNSITTNTSTAPQRIGQTYFLDELHTVNDIIEVNATIDPNYVVEYDITVENNQQTNITISYSADLEVENITLQIELPRYYKTWSIGNQNYNNIYSIQNMTINETIQTIEIVGSMASPSLVSYSFYAFNLETIFTQDFDEEIEFNAYIEFPEANFAFELPIDEDWDLDGVHYSDDDYTIDENNVFYAEFNPSITTCFLRFFVNPVNSFEIEISEEYIELQIDVSIPLENAIFLFTILIDESYKIRDDRVLDLGEYEDVDYYSIVISLEEGMNIIQLEIQRYKTSRTGMYVIIFLALGAFVGLWYYQKKRSEKIENGTQ